MTMSESSSLTRTIQRHLDELKVQLTLGKAEAIDFIEKQKANFKDVVSDVKGKVAEADEAAAEKVAEGGTKLRQKLDELELQLALGRMESRDEYEEQKGKITKAVAGVREEFAGFEEALPEKAQSVKAEFDAGAGLAVPNLRTDQRAMGNIGIVARILYHTAGCALAG